MLKKQEKIFAIFILIFFAFQTNLKDMARPVKPKNVCQQPRINLFKPAGVPMGGSNPVVLTLDEYESIRLADLEGLYQEEAAQYMNTSRQTFARIIESAHRKIASVLVEGRPLLIEGGNVNFCDETRGCGVRRRCCKDLNRQEEE